MVTHFTRTTGPHVTSSVHTSRSTTVTHSGGSSGTKITSHGGVPLTTGHFISTAAPYVTTSTTRYSNAAPTLIGQTTLGGQGSLLTTTPILGSLMPTTGYMPATGLVQHQPLYYSRVGAPIAVSAPMGIAVPTEHSVAATAATASSRMQSSMTINGIHCEGFLGITDRAIVEAQNLFVGVAPFVLDHGSLEVTPELSVVTRNPDIKFHLPGLPDGSPLTLSQLRTLAGLDESATVHIALPGQQSSKLVQEADGLLKIVNDHQGSSLSGNLLGTLRV